VWEKGRRGAGARFSTGAVAAYFALIVVSTVLAGSVLPTPIGEDTYTNAESQHKTQVEPDSFAFGQTIVTTSQSGRYFAGGGASTTSSRPRRTAAGPG
jgi:hypothetical protein